MLFLHPAFHLLLSFCLETPKKDSSPTNWWTEPSLVTLSVISFPLTPACPGIQYSPTACRVEMSFNACWHCRTKGDVVSAAWSAFRAAWLSEQIQWHKKAGTFEKPPKIEEIQEKKIIDRNWNITTRLLRDSNPNYQCLKITSCRWCRPPRMHSFTATTHFESSRSFVSPCVCSMLCRMQIVSGTASWPIIVPMTVDTVRPVLLMMGVCTAQNM